jgi:phytol kinase
LFNETPVLDWFATIYDPWQQAAIVTAWLALIGLLAALAKRLSAPNSENTRKVVHVGVGQVILLAWWMQVPAWMGVSASVFFAVVALLSYYFPLLPSINSVGRKSLGTFFYAVSMGLLVAWFWTINAPEFAALGILIMAWGDGWAALIGQRFGRNLYYLPNYLGGMKKSWEGSATMAGVSLAISLLVLVPSLGNLWQTWAIALVVAMLATGLEAFSWLGLDNLTVPIGSAACAYGLTLLLF